MHQTVRDLLQAEIDQIAVEVGRAFISRHPLPALAEEARTISSLLELAKKRPAVARALAVSLQAPSESLELPADAAPGVLAEQGIEAVEEALAPVAPKPRRSTHRGRPEPKTGKERRLAEIASTSLEPSKPSLAEAVPGETNYQRGLRLGALRVWAAGAGYQLAEKGQVPAPVIAAYEAARDEMRARFNAARETDIERNKLRNELKAQPVVVGGAPRTRRLPAAQASVPCTRPDKDKHATALEAHDVLDAQVRNPKTLHPETLTVYRCPVEEHEHYHVGNARTEGDRWSSISRSQAEMMLKPVGPLNWPKSPLSIDVSSTTDTTSVLVAS